MYQIFISLSLDRFRQQKYTLGSLLDKQKHFAQVGLATASIREAKNKRKPRAESQLGSLLCYVCTLRTLPQVSESLGFTQKHIPHHPLVEKNFRCHPFAQSETKTQSVSAHYLNYPSNRIVVAKANQAIKRLRIKTGLR